MSKYSRKTTYSAFMSAPKSANFSVDVGDAALLGVGLGAIAGGVHNLYKVNRYNTQNPYTPEEEAINNRFQRVFERTQEESNGNPFFVRDLDPEEAADIQNWNNQTNRRIKESGVISPFATAAGGAAIGVGLGLAAKWRR